jgi:conserved oligomeric Golgi complex subunit 8
MNKESRIWAYWFAFPLNTVRQIRSDRLYIQMMIAENSSAAPGSTNSAEDVSLYDVLAPVLNTPASQEYLNHLTTLPLPTLLSEPTTLQTQAHHLTSSLTSLTHSSYQTFLSIHETTGALATSLDALSSSLDSLISESLPALETSAAGWRSRTENVLQERNKARLVLEQHDKLRDLLDIPLLIDNCVRNGYFQEALSLASHANSISKWDGHSPIVSSILSEVHNSITQMLFTLLETLYEPNRKLPTLYKAVGNLRKMGAFESEDGVHSEEQIALAFIGGRESCLKSSFEGCRRDIERLTESGATLKERDKEDLTKYLKKYIDMWREGVQDVITQFTALFLERTTSLPVGKASAAPTAKPALRELLCLYTSYSLDIHLLPLLSTTLRHIPLQSLQSLLTQLTYCATAFGKHGFDFRGLLSGLFSSAVLSSVGNELKQATTKWVKTLKEKTGLDSSASLTNSTAAAITRKTNLLYPSKYIIIPNAIASPPTTVATSSSSTSVHAPPQLLASYPPLAEYLNALLAVLNNLRLLAPVSIISDLQACLDTCLSEGGAALLQYFTSIYDDKTLKNKETFERVQELNVSKAAGEVYFGVLVPFTRRGLSEGIYNVPGTFTIDPAGEGELAAVWNDWERWMKSLKPDDALAT